LLSLMVEVLRFHLLILKKSKTVFSRKFTSNVSSLVSLLDSRLLCVLSIANNSGSLYVLKRVLDLLLRVNQAEMMKDQPLASTESTLPDKDAENPINEKDPMSKDRPSVDGFNEWLMMILKNSCLVDSFQWCMAKFMASAGLAETAVCDNGGMETGLKGTVIRNSCLLVLEYTARFVARSPLTSHGECIINVHALQILCMYTCTCIIRWSHAW